MVADKWKLDRWKDDRPELRWRARWRDARGAQRSKDFRNQKAAEAYERQMRIEADDPPTTSTITVDELVARFLLTKAHLAPKTVEMYGNGSRHILHPEYGFAGRFAADVRHSDVKVWVASIRGSGSLRQQAILTLSGAFDLLVKDQQLPGNPCEDVTVGRGEARDARFLSAEELVRVAAAGVRWVERGIGVPSVEWHDDELMILTMGTTACRLSEAIGLDVSSIHFERGRGRVTKTKGGKARDVPIPADVAELLREHVKRRPGWEPLFRSPSSGRINAGNWRNRVFYPAVEAAEFDGVVKPHDLRHTAASLAIAAGADPKAIQWMMGHRSIKMTLDLYGHLWPGTLDDVAVKVNAMLQGPLQARSEYTFGTRGPSEEP